MTHTLKCILALLLLAGCQNEGIEFPDDNRPNPDGSIGFRLRIEDSLINEDSSKTKGTPHIGLERYDSVCVNVYSHTLDYEETTEEDIKLFQRVRLEPEDPNWKCTPPIFWPTEKKLSFIAYASDITPFEEAGITFEPSTGAPERIIYSVPTDVTRQPDLLVSTKFNLPKVDNVSLNMKHALACVSFCGIAPEDGIFVKSITLRNVYKEGTLTLSHDPIEWTVNPDSKGFTVLEEGAGIDEDQELGKDPLPDNNYLMTEDGYLMMIPQELKDAAIDVLYWNGTDETANKVITYILPVNDESYATWKPGLKYIYKFGSQSEEDITVTYYEKYTDNTYGLYYNQGVPQNTLDNMGEIVEAGYGVLTKEAALAPMVPIRLTTSTSDPVSSGAVVELADIGSFLYPVSQSGSTFALSASSIPVDVYFNNSNKPCGMIVPHFAKGVYTVKTPMKAHFIRTPQQMRNITALGRSSAPKFHTYTQELDLDFSKAAIGGEPLTTSVVNCEFNDVFEGQKKQIKNVKINATIKNGALFIQNYGEINEVCLLNSSISSSGNTGGIAATNELTGVIYHPRIIGENDSDKKFEVQGLSGYVGAIVGLNYGTITGNTVEEVATELPVAEVSGWVSIKGESQPVGGITGENQGTITTCLVNGVHVTGPTLGEVEIAKITIEGGAYVGGIVGVNRKDVIGNYSAKGDAAPDLAGLVSITGTGDWVGGIAGENSGTLNQVNVRLGRGKDATEATTITGKQSVGGIVGYNNGGTLKADGISNSFISVRGNVIISGTNHVGGIVGNNGSGHISNCFVYNFYSQTKPLVHYAPKITGETNVGGIVGYAGTGTIKQCAIFSTVSGLNGGVGEDVTNAVAEVKATTSSAGGIVGRGFTGLNITGSYVLGNVKIDGMVNSGGIVGQNEEGTTITSVHVGNSGTEVSNIYGLFRSIHLPIEDDRMKTGGLGGVMKETSGTPTIVGSTYVGGICGVNWGTVKAVEIKDNVHVGTSSSTFVGGVVGGNGVDAKILDCKTYNPKDGIAAVIIKGFEQVGGIVGLNNGIINQCQLGLSGQNESRPITIQGASSLGGIAGSSGGNTNYPYDKEAGTGNDNTILQNCNVYGQVLIEAVFGKEEGGYQYRVGGILGQNGPTNRVIDCNVIGYTSNDITVRGVGNIGGIAGMNYGIIHGSSSSSNNRVTHTTVIASNGYAGGLVGALKSMKTNSFEAQLYDCDVSNGVSVSAYETHAGAFAGQIEGVGAGAEEANHTLFGTASGGPTNKVCTGINPVLVNNGPVRLAPSIDSFPYPVEPAVATNLWADYQMWNYLYWEEYK